MIWSKPNGTERNVVQSLKDIARQSERDKDAARLKLQRSMDQLKRLICADGAVHVFQIED